MENRHVEYDIRPKALDFEVITLQKYVERYLYKMCAMYFSGDSLMSYKYL